MTKTRQIRWVRRGLELTGALALALIGVPAHAYNTSTHKLLTELAVSRSVVATDFDLFVRLGFANVSARIYFDSEGRGPYTAEELPPFGAVWEDDWYKRIALNHFFDPQFGTLRAGRGLDLGTLDGVPLVGNASVDWSLEDRGVFPDGHGRHTFSIRDAQTYFHAALTAATVGERQTAIARMLQSLGHVVHHIQDMAQPQHVRNDWHLETPLPGLSIPFSSKAYEDHVARRDAEIPGIVAAKNYPTATLDTFRSYWHRPHEGGPGTPGWTGMAEFTAHNFLSPGTAFTLLGNGSIVTRPEFPLPARGRLVQVPRTVTVNGRTYSRSVQVLVGDVYDGLRNVTSTDVPLAEGSLMGPGPAVLYLDRETWDAQLPILLPRAVAFSTGIINHFFRGKIAMARTADKKSWVISNPGNLALIGRVTLYGEDPSGGRAPLSGGQFNVNLPAGGSANVGFPEPSGIARLVAAFQGQIGLEGDSTLQSGYWAVTGQVTPFVALAPPPPPPPPPPASCSGPFSYPTRFGAFSGSGNGPEGNFVDYVMEMGASAGTVVYNGYSIIAFQNAGMAIYANNSSRTKLGGSSFTAFGTGFGPYKVPFNDSVSFNPAQLGTTSVLVRIHSSGAIPTSSELAMGISCPNGSIPDLTTANVFFKVAGNTCRVRWTVSVDGGASSSFIENQWSSRLRLGLHSVSAGWQVEGLGTCGGASQTSPGAFSYSDNRGQHPLGAGTFTFLVN